MRVPPDGFDPAALIELLRRHWDAAIAEVEYLPVGFGAHHWRAVGGAEPYFVTFDLFGSGHDETSLRAAYAGAVSLAESLEFVHAGRAPLLVPFGEGAVSVTDWLVGDRPTELDGPATADLLHRLHASDRPTGVGRWRPLVTVDFTDQLTRRLASPWTGGPYSAPVQRALLARLDEIHAWVARYHELGEVARRRPWVPTHGEPGVHNQLVTSAGLVLVDWESLLSAPAERDLRTLGTGDAEMLELFDLEWGLDEISQYAARFERAHAGDANDEVAFAGLMNELGLSG